MSKRRSGDSELVGGDLPRMVDSWPHVALREATIIVGVSAVLCWLALFVDAPLGGAAVLTEPDNPEKAPWYFVGVQEMVSYSAFTGVLLFPVVAILGGLLIPILDRRGRRASRWFGDAGAAIGPATALVAASAAAVGLWLWEQGITTGGPANPAVFGIAAAVIAGLAGGLWRRSWHSTGVAVVCGLLGSYVLFTVVGQLCRGPSWIFLWPWSGAVGGGP